MTWKEFMQAAQDAGVLDSDEIQYIDFSGDRPSFDRQRCDDPDCNEMHLAVW